MRRPPPRSSRTRTRVADTTLFRSASGVGLFRLTALGRLEFDEPDRARFPCLRLSFDALKAGQAACVALNAANEIAVDCFLKQQIRYTEIARIIEDRKSTRLNSSH